MFHPTARRLDDPYKLYGFTVWQWLSLLLGGGGVIAALWQLHVSLQVGGFVGTLVIGAPALYWLLGESGRVEPAELLLDAARRLAAPKQYEAGPGEPVALLVERPQPSYADVDHGAGSEVPW
jgi:hypothetical protein